MTGVFIIEIYKAAYPKNAALSRELDWDEQQCSNKAQTKQNLNRKKTMELQNIYKIEISLATKEISYKIYEHIWVCFCWRIYCYENGNGVLKIIHTSSKNKNNGLVYMIN